LHRRLLHAHAAEARSGGIVEDDFGEAVAACLTLGIFEVCPGFVCRRCQNFRFA
jgi:hypothetical protein